MVSPSAIQSSLGTEISEMYAEEGKFIFICLLNVIYWQRCRGWSSSYQHNDRKRSPPKLNRLHSNMLLDLALTTADFQSRDNKNGNFSRFSKVVLPPERSIIALSGTIPYILHRFWRALFSPILPKWSSLRNFSLYLRTASSIADPCHLGFLHKPFGISRVNFRTDLCKEVVYLQHA